jgi:hypothetical protein
MKKLQASVPFDQSVAGAHGMGLLMVCSTVGTTHVHCYNRCRAGLLVQERLQLAEQEYERGRAKLKATAGELESLASRVRSSSKAARGGLPVWRRGVASAACL